MQTKTKNHQYGFTLIELLVVVMILGMMAAIAVYAVNEQRKKAQTVRRIADMSQVKKALEYYYQENGHYPITGVGIPIWYTECNHPNDNGQWVSNLAANSVIPGLAPNYITKVPSDPIMDKANCTSYYTYVSDGVNYKFMDADISGLSNNYFLTYPDSIDPVYDIGSPNSCGLTKSTITAFAIYTTTYRCRIRPIPVGG